MFVEFGVVRWDAASSYGGLLRVIAALGSKLMSFGTPRARVTDLTVLRIKRRYVLVIPSSTKQMEAERAISCQPDTFRMPPRLFGERPERVG